MCFVLGVFSLSLAQANDINDKQEKHVKEATINTKKIQRINKRNHKGKN